MTFTLTIELGNDAMQDGTDVASALRSVAKRVDGDSFTRVDGRKIMDANGNSVGTWEVHP